MPAVMLLSVWMASAQNQRVRLSDTRLSLQQTFTQIKDQTGIGIAFNGRLLNSQQVVVFPSSEMTVDQILKKITEGSNFTYIYNGNMVSITKIQVEADTPKTVTARTDDGYKRGSQSDFNHHPLESRQEKASKQPEQPAAIYNIQQSETTHELYSNTRPVEEYAFNQSKLPRFALKTNLLYGLATLTPNLALEIGTGRRTSFEFSASYNPWNLSGSLENNRKLVHMILKPEFRWWTCERFNGHFFGLHAIYGRYNIGSVDVPLLFKKEYRYDGHAYGAGVSYGYHWAFAKRWGMEFNIGAGAMWMKYDRYDCAACNRDSRSFGKIYFGPTDGSISLVFLLK